MAARLPLPRMTSDEFIEWSMARPDGERYELVEGEVVSMASERLSHARVKHRIAQALEGAVGRAGLLCEVFPDGMAIEIDNGSVFEPDAQLRCGDPLPGETVKITDPMLVVEVVSPSSGARDAGAKLEGYFRISSVRHYLIVKTENKTVIHHFRDQEDRLQTRICRQGDLTLDPPGITVPIAAFFP